MFLERGVNLESQAAHTHPKNTQVPPLGFRCRSGWYTNEDGYVLSIWLVDMMTRKCIVSGGTVTLYARYLLALPLKYFQFAKIEVLAVFYNDTFGG